MIDPICSWEPLDLLLPTHLIHEPTAEYPGDDDALVLLLHRQPQLLALLRLGHGHAVHLLQVRPAAGSAAGVVGRDVVDVAGSRVRRRQLGARVIVAVDSGKRA